MQKGTSIRCILAGMITTSLIACSTKPDSPEEIGRKMLVALSKNDTLTIKSLISDDFSVRDCPQESSKNGDTISISLDGNCLKNFLAVPFEKKEKLEEMKRTATCNIEVINEIYIDIYFIKDKDKIRFTICRSTPISNTSEDWIVDDFYINF